MPGQETEEVAPHGAIQRIEGREAGTMKIFKVEAQGDTMYMKAEDQQAAERYLFKTVGEIPRSLLTWTEVDKVPEDEELL